MFSHCDMFSLFYSDSMLLAVVSHRVHNFSRHDLFSASPLFLIDARVS